MGLDRMTLNSDRCNLKHTAGSILGGPRGHFLHVPSDITGRSAPLLSTLLNSPSLHARAPHYPPAPLPSCSTSVVCRQPCHKAIGPWGIGSGEKPYFKHPYLLSNHGTCRAPALLHGTWRRAAPKRPGTTVPRQAKRLQEDLFGRRKSSKIRPESDAALQEIPFHLQVTRRLELPSWDFPAPSCQAALGQSLAPRGVFQQYFVASFTVFSLSHFQTPFLLLPTRIRLIRTSPQGKKTRTQTDFLFRGSNSPDCSFSSFINPGS